MVCPWGFISYSKCSALVGVVDDGKAVCVRGQRTYEKSLYLLLPFTVNVKLLKQKSGGAWVVQSVEHPHPNSWFGLISGS